MKPTREYKELKQELSLFMDGTDDHCTALNCLFDIAETLFLRNDLVPDHWEFKPSLVLKEVDPDSLFADIISTYSTQSLTRLGNVLERYLRIVEDEQ